MSFGRTRQAGIIGPSFGRLVSLAGVTMMGIVMGTALAEDKVGPLERIGVKPGKDRAEFGTFDHHERTFAAAVDNLVQARDLANTEKVNGMLFWTYDCQEQARLYHATDDWELFYWKMGDFEPKS